MSLFALHGTWSPADFSFFLWGEDGHRFTLKRRSLAQKSIPKHPYLVQPHELFSLFPGATEMKRTLILPSHPDLGPVPSPDLVVEPVFQHWDDSGIAPSPWSVTGIALAPEDALTLLATLPPPAIEITYGADMLGWGQVAQFTVAMLAQGRFVPALHTESTRAWWRLLLEEITSEQLNALAAGLAPVCLSLVPPRTQPEQHQPMERHHLVTHFMNNATDGAIRRWLGDAFPQPDRLFADPAREWLASLASPFPYTSTRTARLLGPVVADWAAPYERGHEQQQASTPFRTCLLLEPPSGEAEEPSWRLKVMLQGVTDPSLFVPVQHVWREAGPSLQYLGHRFEKAQERLFRDLTGVVRLFPPVFDLLRHRTDEVELTVEQAFQFLQAASAITSGSEMGVLLPSSLERRLSPSVRAHLRTPPGGAVRVGLNELLEIDWEIALGDQPVSMAELKRLAELKTPLISLGGRWVEVDAAALERLSRRVSRQAGRITLAESLRLMAGDPSSLDGLALDGVELDHQLSHVLDRLNDPARLVELGPPAGLTGELRPYQVRGFSWLAFLRSLGIGACLADDMGLGKTIQLIALLLHEREQMANTAPTLLICPTSLVGNWQRELARFAPSLRVMVHHGPDRLKGTSFADAAREHDVVISTYGLSHRDLADLSSLPWTGLVLDEAQNIKNAETRQRQSLRALRAGYRIALTGTPVENRLDELWSLMDFLNPGLLGSRAEFRAQFATPIERRGDEAAALRLRRIVQPFLLRRLKSDPTILADLPEKLEQNVYVSLTTEQASLYASLVDDMMRQINSAEGIRRRGLVLAALTRLKQICNHPAHFLGDSSRLAGRSGKLDRLAAMLEEVLSEGDAALVFTQYAEMGRLLQAYLTGSLDEEVLFLHGQVPGEERSRLVQRFQEVGGPRILILTLKAGGVGLNLTRASHVIHYDRWWNPAVENQATDRAYRIGQNRTVLVHKLIAAGTVEEKIDALIAGKRLLADRVVGTGEAWLTELSTAELRTLFALNQEE